MGDEGPLEGEPQKMKKKVIYELAADATCLFEDGQTIQVCKAMLAVHGQYFMDAFFGTNPVTQIKIKGFDKDSFKTFLDCLFGMKPYTILDSLLIYPIAHQYDAKESLEKCVAILKPKQMDENVPLVLNLSTFYKCHELTDFVTDFIKAEYGVINLLENEKYRNALEPLAVVELIKNADLNSLVWTFVWQWGSNYVKRHGESNVRSLFAEHDILEKISLAHFESAKALTNFHESSDQQLLCPNEILNHLETNNFGNGRNLPDKSSWSKINSGDTFTETIVFKRAIWGHRQSTLIFKIQLRRILIEPSNLVQGVVEVMVRYYSRNVTWGPTAVTSNVWRWENFNFYYCDNEPTEKKFLFSPFFPSNTVSFDIDVNGDGNELCAQFETKLETDHREIISFEVTYTFNFNCRILKTSLNTGKILGDVPDRLFFTKNISVPAL